MTVRFRRLAVFGIVVLVAVGCSWRPPAAEVDGAAVPADRIADRVEITVADDGIGMASDDVDQIFTPYFRAQSVQDSGIAGTGLGMGITRDIVAEHGGTITIDSALGKGTTVTLSLPVATIDEEGAQ